MAKRYSAAREQVKYPAETALPAPSLRQFTLDFFSLFGATLAANGNGAGSELRVALAGDLADYFGRDNLWVCFDHARADSPAVAAVAGAQADCELVARGSRLFDRMMSYLDTRSASTLLILPRRDTNSEELMRAVRPRNASVTNLQMREETRHLYVFNWRLTFRSDEKYEELYSVLLNDAGDRLLPSATPKPAEGAYALDELFADGQAASQENGNGTALDASKLPPMTRLSRLAESARKHAVYHADVQSAAHEAEILPRLYRALNRVTTYYGQQIEEVYDTHDRDGEKRRALEEDMQRKIAEEVENHRLRVGVELFSYAVFEMPVAVAEMTLTDGKREAAVQVTHNRYSGAIERPRCHACGAEAADIVLDRNGHVTCDACTEQCASCAEIVCAACGVEPCSVCGKEICESCGERCWACGERACEEHLGACPVCGDRVCHACQDECSHCGVRQCRSHLIADAVLAGNGDQEWICEVCAMRCPGCRQFSARVGACEQSGQQFCENCLVQCATCGRRVGPGFYQTGADGETATCMSCLRECPGCGQLAADIVVCDTCGAQYCETCGLACAICGGHCCEGAYERFARCGHTVCADHVAHCSFGSEPICPLCSATCGICDQPHCDAHSTRCRHCGQHYCGRCVNRRGFCDTCEMLIAGHGEAIDMLEEPCMADLEVGAMARHYSWERAGNHRYVVYEGRDRFMGGAVVVVDSTRGEANVAEVRRIGLLEVVRDRLMGPYDAD